MTDEQINDIAQDLGMGLKCYVHKETKDVVVVPEDETGDLEWWQDSIDKLKKNSKSYIEIKKMDEHESFQAMETFIESVDDNQLRNKLEDAIRRTKPFRNFKFEIDNAGPYREQWFAYKNLRAFESAKKQVEAKGL